MSSFISICDYIGQYYYMNMYMLIIILSLHHHPFTKDILLAEALSLSTANVHTVFECIGICIYA